MNDSKKNKPGMQPPDGYSKTTPNFRREDFEENEWGKTRYNAPSEAPADEWGKTVINYNVSNLDKSDIGKQLHPSPIEPSEPDWGMTQPRLHVDDEFKPAENENEDEGHTVAYIKLPEADRKKYQTLPPTPTERAQQEEEKRKKKGGVPVWFWVGSGLLVMFSFAAIVLLGAYFLFSGASSFTVRIKGAQPNSQFYVDKSRWGVENTSGDVDLDGLQPGTRNILVRKKGFEDFEQELVGTRGEIVPVIVSQRASANECQNAEAMTDVNKREECANIILNNLDTPPNLDDLLRALNLYYINFASGDYAIPEQRKKFLERATTYIKQMPANVVIEIGGHTDNVGEDASNQILSEKRAESVKDFFVKSGLSESQFTTKGYGESDPKESNDTEDGRFQNRRIAYKVVKQ